MDIYEELHSRYIQLYASAMDLDKDHHTKFDLVMKKYQKTSRHEALSDIYDSVEELRFYRQEIMKI